MGLEEGSDPINIEELKNNSHPDVVNFIHKFSHFAIMQSGINRSSKYSMLPIINQSYFEQMITNQIGLPYIYQVLDELQKSFDSRERFKEIDAQIIDQFKSMYQSKIAGNGMRIKVRGANYVVNKLKFSKDISLKKSKARKSNITKIALGKELTSDQHELQLEYFYNDESKTPLQIAESIQDMEWVIRDKKFIAPEGKSQKELDKALLVLGIDNAGVLPVINYKTKIIHKKNDPHKTAPTGEETSYFKPGRYLGHITCVETIRDSPAGRAAEWKPCQKPWEHAKGSLGT
jgi:hypothetical protein